MKYCLLLSYYTSFLSKGILPSSLETLTFQALMLNYKVHVSSYQVSVVKGAVSIQGKPVSSVHRLR